MKNLHPLLALQAFRQALEMAPDHEFADQAGEIIPTLEPMMQEALETLGVSDENSDEEKQETMAIAPSHERGQMALQQGEYDAARAAEEKVLEYRSNFMPAYNNLSLVDTQLTILSHQGNLESAQIWLQMWE